MDVTLDGFPPNMTVTVTCHGETANAFSSTDENDTATHEACYFGHPDERFHVSANGITSPTITWTP